MNQKDIYHAIENVNLMIKNVTVIKIGITVTINMSAKV